MTTPPVEFWALTKELSDRPLKRRLHANFVDYCIAAARTGIVGSWTPVNESDFINLISQAPEVSEVTTEPTWFEEQFRAAFGYTRKLPEICERLDAIEAAIVELGKKIDQKTFESSLLVPIESFEPEPYKMLRPLTAVVTRFEGGFEAGIFDLNLFASGDTEPEAVSNLKSMILETYEALQELADSELGPEPLRQKRILASLVIKV